MASRMPLQVLPPISLSDLAVGGFLIGEKPMKDDNELLRDYGEHHTEAAFSELVARHIDLVYSVAVRLVGGDTHLAQDVVQTVFTDLSGKAKSLRGISVLPAWLHRHTFFVASTVVRTEQRRRHREQEAVQMNALTDSTRPDWDRLVPVLDQALQCLGADDRQAIVLRYLQGRDLKTVGIALGTSEDAAQKRVSRALERLRCLLAKGSVTLTTAALATVMASHAVTAAPIGMAASVTAAVLAGSGTASSAALTWIKFMAWLKTKTTIVSATVVLLTSITTVYLLQTRSSRSAHLATEGQGARASLQAHEMLSFLEPRNGGFGFQWSQVESADYRQYVANLRAIGCPEETIRDIIIADLNASYLPRRQAIHTWPVRAYWKKTENSDRTPDQMRRLIAMEEEKAGIVKELLGISIGPGEFSTIALLQLQPAESQFLFLPPDKREAARLALIESGLEEKGETMRTANPHIDPERLLFDEKLKVLAQVLTPDELDEFRLRHSPRAQWLRGDVDFFDCTPEEFKALLDLREQHLGPANDNLATDRATAIADFRKLFGDERAKEYERVSDFGYQNTRRAAERAGLSPELADQAGQIGYEARVAVEQAANNNAFSIEDRRRQIDTLQTQAEARLKATLQDQATLGIRNALRRTLANTAQILHPSLALTKTDPPVLTRIDPS
jgi:RNA polymerase sigma factor (sigma-70 family)